MKAARVSGLLAAVLLVAACDSLPRPQWPEWIKTLLVIPIAADVTASTPIAPDAPGPGFWIRLQDGSIVRPVCSASGVWCVSTLDPGTYTIVNMGTFYTQGFGLWYVISSTWPMEPVTFTLTEGAITILPVSVVSSLKDWRPRFVPTNRDEVLAQLAHLRNFSLWKVAP
jgi:hypothetical protein